MMIQNTDLFFFHDTFKASNHILTNVSRANGIIGWRVRNYISKEANAVFKIYKAQIRPHIEYCSQFRSQVSRHGNWSVIQRSNLYISL